MHGAGSAGKMNDWKLLSVARARRLNPPNTEVECDEADGLLCGDWLPWLVIRDRATSKVEVVQVSVVWKRQC